MQWLLKPYAYIVIIKLLLIFFFLVSHEEEKSQNQLINDQLKERLNKLTKESENLSGERLKLLEEIDDIKNTLTIAQKGVATGERKHLTEVSSMIFFTINI